MRYLVRARMRPGHEALLLDAIEAGTLGAGSVAGDEYLRNMAHAREMVDGSVRWVEVCFCPVPLMEERPYWEEYFELTRIQDAHARAKCRDENGTEPWACSDCDCTDRLERRLAQSGSPFVERLRVKGAGIRIFIGTTQDIDQLAARAKAAGVALDVDVHDTPWGSRAFEVTEPSGFRLTISSER